MAYCIASYAQHCLAFHCRIVLTIEDLCFLVCPFRIHHRTSRNFDEPRLTLWSYILVVLSLTTRAAAASDSGGPEVRGSLEDPRRVLCSPSLPLFNCVWSNQTTTVVVLASRNYTTKNSIGVQGSRGSLFPSDDLTTLIQLDFEPPPRGRTLGFAVSGAESVQVSEELTQRIVSAAAESDKAGLQRFSTKQLLQSGRSLATSSPETDTKRFPVESKSLRSGPNRIKSGQKNLQNGQNKSQRDLKTPQGDGSRHKSEQKRSKTGLNITHTGSVKPKSTSSRLQMGPDEPNSGPNKLYIGGLFELSNCSGSMGSGKSDLASAKMAIDHVNSRQFVPGYELELIYNDTKVRESLSETMKVGCCSAVLIRLPRS